MLAFSSAKEAFACVFIFLSLTSATQILSGSISPRGWEAAQRVSEELQARLKAPRNQAYRSKEVPKSPIKEQTLPAQQLTTDASPTEPQICACNFTVWQLALPTLALVLVSGVMGWALRGGGAVLTQRERKNLLQSRLSPEQFLSQAQSNSRQSIKAQEPLGKGEGIAGSRRVEKQQSAPTTRGRVRQEVAEEGAAARGLGKDSKDEKGSPSNPGETKGARQKPHQHESRVTAVASGEEPKSRRVGELQPEDLSTAAQSATISEPSTPSKGADSGQDECTTVTVGEAELVTPVRGRRANCFGLPLSAPPSGASPGWLRRSSNESPAPRQQSSDDSAVQLTSADTVDDVTVVMETLAVRLCLDADSMSPQERMQLLQMALQCCQHRESSWLHAQANEIRYSHAAAAHGSLRHQQEVAAAAEELRQMDAFSKSLQDGLLAGLALMLAVLVAAGVQCGFITSRIMKCRSLDSLPSVTILRPWAVLEAVGVVGCWAQATSDAILACSIMLGAAFMAVRGGILHGSAHEAPQLKLALGLGLVCGLAGYLAVTRLGGSGMTWLTLWVGWVAMHMAASWQLCALHRALSNGRWASWKLVLHQTTLSLAMPLAMGILPFQGCALRAWSASLAFLKG